MANKKMKTLNFGGEDTYILTPEWNNIEGKTHWVEPPVTITEDILEETTYEFIEGLYQGVGSLNLVEGADCTVTWDGTEYTSTCQKLVDPNDPTLVGFWLGNPILAEAEENPVDNGQPFAIMSIPGFGMLMMVAMDMETPSHTVKVVSTYTTQEIHKLDNKYIDAEWIAEPPIYETLLEIPETTVTTATSTSLEGMYEGSVTIDTPVALKVSDKVTIEIDGVEYTSTVLIDGIFGNLNYFIPGLGFGNDDPYIGAIEGNTIHIYFTTEGDHIIKLTVDRLKYKQLPYQYISESISQNSNIINATGEGSVRTKYAKDTTNNYAFAEGYDTTASGQSSHAEGQNTTASGMYSHAEGGNTIASNSWAHAEGYSATASGSASHAEGANTVASGMNSHAEGIGSKATGSYSHAEGQYTIAAGQHQHVQGKYNIEDTNNTYAHIVGNGEASTRSNAHTLDWNGNAWFKGSVYVGGTNQNDATMLATTDDVGVANMTASLAMPGSLKWDGVVGDKDFVLFEPGGMFDIGLVHVSDEIPTILEPSIPALVAMRSVGGFTESIEMPLEIGDDGAITSEGVIIIPHDNYTFADMGVTLPKKGVYFMTYHCAPMGIDYSYMYVTAFYITGHSFADGGRSKYFETKTETTVAEVGDTVTFDGNIDNRANVLVHTVPEQNVYIYYVKIADSIPTRDDLVNGLSGTFYTDSGIPTFSATNDQFIFYDDGFITDNDDGIFMVVPYDNYLYDPITFPEKGIYVMHQEVGTEKAYISSIHIPNYNFVAITTETSEIIKYKHLPKALQFGGGETFLPEVTIVGRKLDGSSILQYPILQPVDIEVGKEYRVTYNGTNYDCVATDITSLINISAYALGNLSMAVSSLPNTGEPFVIEIVKDADLAAEFGMWGAIIPAEYSTEVTLSISSKFIKIDPKYLPDNIGGGGSSLPEVTTADNGSFLRVVNGVWTAVVLPNAEDGEF